MRKRALTLAGAVLALAWVLSLVTAPQSGAKATIAGVVRDTSGRGIQTVISVDALDLGDQGWVRTDKTGHYSFQVNLADQYIVTVNPLRTDWQQGHAFPYKYMPEKRLLIRTSSSLAADFVLQPAGTLWLRAFAPDGHEMTRQEFPSAFIGAFPPGELPIGLSLQAKCNSHPLFWGWIENPPSNTACMLLPARTPGAIWAMWHVPGAGTTFLHADNGAAGYSLAEGAIESMNLVYEFADTELRELNERSTMLLAQVYNIADTTRQKLATANSLIVAATSAQTAGDWASAAAKSYAVLENVILAREELELGKARQDIAGSRVRRTRLKLVDPAGNPLPGASVEFAQASQDFLLSIGWPLAAQYGTFLDAGFEYACTETWWGEVRRADGTYIFPDAEIDALARAGLGLVMHASVWLSPAYPQGVPGIASTMSPDALAESVAEYSRTVLQHYAGWIPLYCAFNEPDLEQVVSLTLPEMEEIVNSSAQGAKQGDPATLTYVNISAPIMGPGCLDSVTYKAARDMNGNTLPGKVTYAPPTSSGIGFLQALYAKPTAVDVTGLEFYYGVTMPPMDIGLFSRVLDAYGALGKPVFISELSYATLDDYPGLTKFWSSYGGWHGGYTDQAQADWASGAVTVAFSKPYVMGVQWVAANDGPPQYDFVGDGLFHDGERTPRPALSAVADLIGSWTAHGSARTDSRGQFDLMGTLGTYKLTIQAADGRRYTATLHLPTSLSTAVVVRCQPGA
jgi:hypothetical protein